MPQLRSLHLLPYPKEVRATRGRCRVGHHFVAAVYADDPRVERALERWRAGLPPCGPDASACEVVVSIERGSGQPEQGYTLVVEPSKIVLTGGSAAGCFHGLQTLTQLARSSDGVVPCGVIRDWPDFATRGLLHDVTRGKVPTLDTLCMLVDRLAEVKINQLQLNIEHAFAFRFDPEICDANHGLTPDEIKQLDAYCRERFIDLVPAVATLGHMGRILSMPKYRHLAEIGPTAIWDAMPWPQRLRGSTLNCMNADAWGLVERILSDVLDAFSSNIVNICGDEPWDLGKGLNRERLASENARGRAYLDHIGRVHQFCASRGRRTQFWSDVVVNHPSLFDRVPRDATVLHWGYDDRADYDGMARLVEAGLRTLVCPGTSGWKRIINAMTQAERNIATFAVAGRTHGASGLLNTDWGDHGHFNQLACSWHGIALGAVMGWDADHRTGPEFDALFSRTVLGLGDGDVVAALRRASAWADGCETWRLLWQPLAEVRDDPTLPTLEEAEQVGAHARDARLCCDAMEPSEPGGGPDRNELSVACTFSELLADKVVIIRRATAGSRLERRIVVDWSERLGHAFESYAACWHARNKPTGLDDICRRLGDMTDEMIGKAS